ncbi:hypothetical protein AAFF_G00193500 [Aldrovandia affinis]|uniref:Uncharacterized protein n=1 Tax=Aldrovandia affinis TaxID=143900 RepID=A0AAD7SXC9_9TELE|nr:hypothetical protein AAFF_G00193500 [Aldrovandia affinis]
MMPGDVPALCSVHKWHAPPITSRAGPPLLRLVPRNRNRKQPYNCQYCSDAPQGRATQPDHRPCTWKPTPPSQTPCNGPGAYHPASLGPRDPVPCHRG